MPPRPPRVFVSATSRDLKTAREGVFDVLTTLGVAAVEQTHFPPDHRTIRDMLRAKIEGCDAVVHIAGCVYGGAPDPTPDLPPRSYTQLEVEIADELGKPVYVFLTTSDFPFDEHDPEPAELAKLQREHCARLRARKQKWEQVSNPHHLQARVAVTPFPGMQRFADPHKPANLPFDSLGTLFKGRDEFLVRLWKSLEAGGGRASAVVAKQAIHGLGGVGKTRTAVEYALRFADRYRGLFSVTADSPLALTQNLAALCGPRVLNLPEQDDPNLSRQEAAALRWLAANPGWFLILDNVDTEGAAGAVEKLLPGLGGGHVVITSRLSNWSGGVEPLELDVLDEAPAAEFLLERTAGKRKVTPTDSSEAVSLARDLGCLALALEQAGAFVVKYRCSLADYRARWRKQEAKVLEWYDARLMKYPRSVATTWQTSFDALGADGRGLLNVLAWLAPEPVPLIMLAKLGTPEGAAPIDVEAGCADLADYSLVKWDGNSNAVKAHRLVLDVTRYRTPEGERRGWLERALGMVNAFVVGDPLDVRTWKDVYDPASDHALAVTAHADEAAIPDQTARLMAQLGVYFYGRAEYAEAETLCRRVAGIFESSFGPDHPNVGTALGNLAELLRATNRSAEAEPLFRRVAGIFESSFGPDHPKVGTALGNLAGLLLATSRHADAEPLYRRALAIDERSYGPDHPKVGTALGNLAGLLLATNRPADAEPLYRRALAMGEASYGPDHPTVATRLNNLAELLCSTNRHAEAEPLHRRALVISEVSYGPDHPNVAARLSNLAGLLGATNRHAEAEPLYRRALAIDERSYGPDHPSVAIDLNNLALLLCATNRHAEADPLYARAIRIWFRFQQLTGYKHSDWDAGVNNYAGFLMNSLNLSHDQAIARFREVLGLDAPTDVGGAS